VLLIDIMSSLLAVDLGLKTGLALYDGTGHLRWYRSKHFGSAARLKRGVFGILKEISDISLIVVEGGGTLAAIWEHEAQRRDITIRQIGAEQWRRALLYPREQKTGPQAKYHADDLARKVIRWSGIAGPPVLRHDTAEAILIGFWAVLEEGWLKEMPGELRR